MSELTLDTLKRACAQLESIPPPIEMIAIHPNDFDLFVALMAAEGYFVIPSRVEVDGYEENGTPINWRMEDDGRSYFLVAFVNTWPTETKIYCMEQCKPGEWIIIDKRVIQDVLLPRPKLDIHIPDYPFADHFRLRFGGDR